MLNPDPTGGSQAMPQGSGGRRQTVGLFSSAVPRELLYALGCTDGWLLIGVFTYSEIGDLALLVPRNWCFWLGTLTLTVSMYTALLFDYATIASGAWTRGNLSGYPISN